ncbi:MAG: efflux RND transporter periplasmic adaptor subunit [Chlamydiales bacterium]|jgi:multidrug efflux system membrane fusion protein|nr:efflux RND transporter periplasmic adaptor subunit [Chlamydiales bacterium]
MKWLKFLLFFSLFYSCQKKPQVAKPHEVVATRALKQTVQVYKDYVGTITAKSSIQVRAQVSGTLVGQYFMEGQFVRKGDLLLVIDPRPYQASLDKAKAEYFQTLTQLKLAEDTLQRYAKLAAQDYISQLNYDQYVAHFLEQKAVVGQSVADLENAKIHLQYCYIHSPIDAITGKLQFKPGNHVDMNQDATLTLLNQIDPILVDFSVPESDLFTIQKCSQKSFLKLYIFPTLERATSFEGQLTFIDNQINTKTGTVLLEGTLNNHDYLLWPGHFVNVRLVLEEKESLILPSEAIRVGQNGCYVYTINQNMEIETRSVIIGQRYENGTTSIESGISTHDILVAQGLLDLYPGKKVHIQTWLHSKGVL